jgi:transcriptional regulator with XRE-family HTH domain
METLAQRVLRKRKEMGWSQADLALEVKRVNRSLTTRQSTIAAIEEGRSQKPTILFELAKALNVSEEWLKTGKEPVQKQHPSQAPVSQDYDLIFAAVKGSYRMLGLDQDEAEALVQLVREVCEEPLTPSASDDPASSRRILAESATRKFLKSKPIQ